MQTLKVFLFLKNDIYVPSDASCVALLSMMSSCLLWSTWPYNYVILLTYTRMVWEGKKKKKLLVLHLSYVKDKLRYASSSWCCEHSMVWRTSSQFTLSSQFYSGECVDSSLLNVSRLSELLLFWARGFQMRVAEWKDEWRLVSFLDFWILKVFGCDL